MHNTFYDTSDRSNVRPTPQPSSNPQFCIPLDTALARWSQRGRRRSEKVLVPCGDAVHALTDQQSAPRFLSCRCSFMWRVPGRWPSLCSVCPTVYESSDPQVSPQLFLRATSCATSCATSYATSCATSCAKGCGEPSRAERAGAAAICLGPARRPSSQSWRSL